MNKHILHNTNAYMFYGANRSKKLLLDIVKKVSEEKDMALVGVEVMKAKHLPLKVRQKNGIFEGLVEIRYERNSPLKPVVNKLEGTFSQKLRSVMEKEGKLGKVTFDKG